MDMKMNRNINDIHFVKHINYDPIISNLDRVYFCHVNTRNPSSYLYLLGVILFTIGTVVIISQ